jgi:uracil-DNA glycosylase family 4
MKKNYNLIETLELLDQECLNEIYFDQVQNHFLIKDQEIKLKSIDSNNNNLAINNAENMNKNLSKSSTSKSVSNVNSKSAGNSKNPILTNVNSLDNAIANLAKKNQLLVENISSNDDSNLKFIPIDELISIAKKIAKNCKTLEELKIAVEKFEGCNLKKMATNTVFCDGNPQSKIMVIGEAPGNHEDLKGIPFCGDSGNMLNEMLMSINLKRENDFYLTNVIFWRPPGNRRPTDEELAICRPFVERHIALFAPKIIILVGSTAMSAILGLKDPITKIRGEILDYQVDFLTSPSKIFTIFHPSFLMRQPMKKKLVWQDMLTLEKFIKNDFL